MKIKSPIITLCFGMLTAVSLTAQSEILLQETFESGDMSTTTNADGFSWNANNRTSIVTENPQCGGLSVGTPTVIYNNGITCSGPKIPYGGGTWTAFENNNSLRFRYPANTNTEAEQRFKLGAPRRELWVQYWLRVPANYTHASANSPNNHKINAFWMDGYSQNGQGATAIWEMWDDGSGGSRATLHYNSGGDIMLTSNITGTFLPDEVVTATGGKTGVVERSGVRSGKSFVHAYATTTTGTWSGTLTGATSGATATIDIAKRWSSGGHKQSTPFISVPADRGRWMQLVFHIKASSSNTSDDGILEMWRRWEGGSFKKLHEMTDAIMPVPIGGPNGWTAGYLMGNTHGYFEDTEWLIDNFIISDTPLDAYPNVVTVEVAPKPPSIVAIQ
jgi:hypothetical protein